MAFLLDTCVAIDLRDGRGDTVANVTALETRPYISAISKVELEGGVYANPEYSEMRRRALDVLLRRLLIIDFDSITATTYGEIIAKTGFNRRKVIDRMIAATALVHQLTLITTNADDFVGIDGLRLKIWKI